MLTGTVNNIIRLSYEYHNVNLFIFLITFKPPFRVDCTDSREDTIENILGKNLEIPLCASPKVKDPLRKLLNVRKIQTLLKILSY